MWLKELHFEKHSLQAILADIMGRVSSGIKELGLVDADDKDDFTAKFNSLKKRWNELESNGRLTSMDTVEFKPEFYEWFKKYKYDDMCDSMIRSVRVKAGLGECPPPFYTNLSESLNRHLKRKVDRKATSLVTFVDHMQELATQQKMQVEKAIVRKGSWRLAEQFSNLEVPDDIWFTAFSTEDKEKRIKKLLAADVSAVPLPLSQRQPESEEDVDLEEDVDAVDLEEDVEAVDLEEDVEGDNGDRETLQPKTPKVKTPKVKTPPQLSVSYSTLREENIQIHEETLKAMWIKAASLVNTSGMITVAPDNTSKLARMVASSRSELPHFVSVPKQFAGQFLCDGNCPMFGAYKICAHTLATAEVNGKLKGFLTWFSKSLRTANLSKLSNIGMPAKSGKKKGARGSSRRKRANKATLATTQRIRLPDPASATSSASQPVAPAAMDLTQSFSPTVNIAHSSVETMSVQGATSTQPLTPSFQTQPFQIQSFITQHSSPFPFTLKFITNRIQKCQGCQLQFRLPGVILQPPYDLIVCRLERRPFKNAAGELTTPWKPSHAHYHLDIGCIKAADSSFLPSSLAIPGSVRLLMQPVHKEKLFTQFGLIP